MKKSQFAEFAAGVLGKAEDLLAKKNSDYTISDEAFENFEMVAKIASTLGLDLSRREHGALYMLVVKLVRLRTVDTRCPNFESIMDTCIDGINYFLLYGAMVTEKTKNQQQERTEP